MALTYSTDTSAADWIANSDTPAMQLIFFGPATYEAFARLCFIPDPTSPDQDEADVQKSDDHPSDITQTRRTLHQLSRFTTTPNDCYFCLWEGYSDIPLPVDVSHGPLVTVPHRRYALLHGSLDDIETWESLGTGGPIAPPAFAWPADRAWCFASDVDPHWAGIGATQAAIDSLASDSELDVVPSRPTDPQPLYR